MAKKSPKKRKIIKNTPEFSSYEIVKMIDDSKEEILGTMKKMVENLEIMTANEFKETRKEIREVDERLIHTKEDILRKMDGTNGRIDDVVYNKVSRHEFKNLDTRVRSLEFKAEKK